MKGSTVNFERIELNRISSPSEGSSIRNNLTNIDSFIVELEEELDILTRSISDGNSGPIRKVK